MSKSFKWNAANFLHLRLHIALNPNAEPKKLKVYPNKTV